MQSADLYIRVSTDEQASRGYSKGFQEDLLRHYCLVNNVRVRDIIHEDFSAKDFNRPQWNELFAKYRTNKLSRPNYILFTQWSRFCRNIAEAYIMIKKLQDLGINPQAIEQPLDMSVPENKITLAFYLVAPEVENDRRSLNVKAGIQKARSEGRWTSTAPIGYINRTSATGQKYIALKEPEASLLKEAFELIAEGQFSTRQVYYIVTGKGLQCSKNNFWHAIKNPVYCGRIIIKKNGNATNDSVEGRHEKLVPPILFDKVQSVLKAKSKPIRKSKTQTSEALPFRGFLYCPGCNNRMTGSASKGRTKQYFYYHCNYCGFRVRADTVLQHFLEILKQFQPASFYLTMFRSILEKNLKNTSFLESVNQRLAIKRIEELRTHIDSAGSLLLSKEIQPREYLQLKQSCESKILILNQKLDDAAVSLVYFKSRLEIMSLPISNLVQFFHDCKIEDKRRLLTLLLNTKIQWSDSHFQGLFNDHVNIVFQQFFKKGVVDNVNSISQLESYTSEHRKIYEMEHSKGNLLSPEQVQNILSLFHELANLSIDVFKYSK